MTQTDIVLLDNSEYAVLATSEATPLPAPAIHPTPQPTPEDILRAVFTQALTGKPATMPPGATVSLLREALVLNPATSARIFHEVKARIHGPPPQSAHTPQPPPQPAPLPEPQLFHPSQHKEQPPAIPPPAPPPAKPKPSRKIRMAKILIAIATLIAIAAATTSAIILKHPKTATIATAPQNPSAYAKLLARAQAGDAQAQYALATLLDRSKTPAETFVPKNDAQAAEWYSQAANANYPPAEQNLGYAYLTGHGVPRNPATAAHWYQLAATAGLPVAENSLGFMALNGAGMPQNSTQAVALFRAAAAQNLPEAQNNLANAYETGNGIGQDDLVAAAWYTRAAQQGEPNAQNSLGFLYFNGLGVPRNLANAFKLFAAAATAGNPAAMVNLGLSYINGDGTPKNPVTGATWLYAGLAHGAKSAAAAITLVTPILTPAQLAAAKAAAAKLN